MAAPCQLQTQLIFEAERELERVIRGKHEHFLLVEKTVAVDAVKETDPRSEEPGPA